jgi:hypothetical protein
MGATDQSNVSAIINTNILSAFGILAAFAIRDLLDSIMQKIIPPSDRGTKPVLYQMFSVCIIFGLFILYAIFAVSQSNGSM